MMAAFSDVFADVTKQGTKLQTSEYLASGKYPIIDQGQDDIAGYTDRENGLFTDVPAIIFGDHTRIVKYVDMPFFLGADGVKVLKATIPNVDCRYLYYAVSAVKIPNTGYNRHFKWLKEAQIPLPDISTQRRIADTLDKVSEGIEVCRRMLGELDLMVKAKFVEMFGDFKYNTKSWKVLQFDNFAVIDANMTTDYEKYAAYPHIGIDSIEKETGELRGYRTVKEDGVISGKYIFTQEHIIYSKIRPNLNKVALPTFDGLCSADAYPILPKKGVCSRVFLAHVMRSPFFLDYILQFSARSNMPKVNRKEIAGFKSPIPPIELQNEFESFVSKTDKTKLTIQKILDKMEMEKLALMQKYFA